MSETVFEDAERELSPYKPYSAYRDSGIEGLKEDTDPLDREIASTLCR